MKKVMILLFAVMLLSVSAVSAAEDKPILKSGKLVVSFGDAVNVSEEITLENAEMIPQGQLEHIATKIGGSELGDLAIKANGQELTYEVKEGESVDKITVSLPDGVRGELTYTITYQYSNVEIEKIPFVVPAVSSAGNGNVVSLKVDLPEGKYLHESFPIIDSGDTGSVEENMMNIPSFVGLKTGSSPAGFFTTSNLYTVFGLAVILGIIVAWMISERKNKAGEAVNV